MPLLSDCASCRGRAISCDRSKPICTNCSRSNRNCQWHRLKLSWPRADDRRRAVVCKSSHPLWKGRISNARFVHTTYWDIEFYHKAAGSVPTQPLTLRDPSMKCAWDPAELQTFDPDLLEYFCHVASTSLATLGQPNVNLGSILVQISLQGKTPSAAALIQALMAFSSLHRYGLQSQALEAKIAALGSLATGSSESDLGPAGALQHIATGMLLCSFEVHQASCTSGQWTHYLAGVKTVINAISTEKLLQFSPDVAVLFDWLHYHDVLARFSLRHWQRDGASREIQSTPTDHFCSQISTLPPSILSMLDLLSRVFDTIVVSSSDVTTEASDKVHDDQKSFLGLLEWRIRSLPIPNIAEDDNDTTSVLKLYRLAALLYLNRASGGIIDHPTRTQQHIDQAFAILAQMESCKQQFPVFILGCESRTDEQRAIILDIISRTEKMSSSRAWIHCQRLVQAFWAQDDLAEWNDIGYGGKLSRVMNIARIVPAFV